MSKILHISDGWELTNGAANIARLIASDQKRRGDGIAFRRWASIRDLRAADEVWINCGWKPCLWWAAFWARRALWVPEGCYDPIRLAYHGWKKRLVGPLERFSLRRSARIFATCAEEAQWIRGYLGTKSPPIEVLDVVRFFSFKQLRLRMLAAGDPLRVLYLGRDHPLKGIRYLDVACERLGKNVTLRKEGALTGEELEKVWKWCDVLVLPTLSDNFGLVVAEALSRGVEAITTDGAPAWNDVPGVSYLKGFREGSDETRISQLVAALLDGIRRRTP